MTDDTFNGFVLIPTDNLKGTVVVTTNGSKGKGQASDIVDLANKAASDAGFSYTYQDGIDLLYPNYPLNPAAGANVDVSAGFKVYTLRFAEPRLVKTRDEIVHQIVQVGFPNAADTTRFTSILNLMASRVEGYPAP